jgi:hypothetical protein
MEWDVLFTDEFGEWWNGLTESEQVDVNAYVTLLQKEGPNLPFPYSSDVEQSKYPHMRELRVQHAGRPYRVLYAFDPKRSALLLIGGDKTGNERWYDIHVPIADRLYGEHIATIEREDHAKFQRAPIQNVSRGPQEKRGQSQRHAKRHGPR